MVTTNGPSPLEEVACCRGVPEYHDPVPREDSLFSPGHMLDDRFLILEVLSRGGTSTVYKAEDTRNDGRLVAVKMLHSKCESDPDVVARFELEERIGLELHHPYLLKFVPVTGKKSRHYLVTEYLRGSTIEHLPKVRWPWPEKDALKIASLLCEALQYLHDHGIIHRDLKPQNVMICCDGTIRIMDFGIARKMAMRRLTIAGPDASPGTPDYMAPEQVQGKAGDARTDIYNLGALLYEMLTGSIPFANENTLVALQARVTSDPVAPRKLNRELSPQAEEIVLRALQRAPGDRYPTVAAMKAELDRPEHVRVTGLGERLDNRESWNRQEFWARIAVVAGPIITGLLVFLLMSLRYHAGSR